MEDVLQLAQGAMALARAHAWWAMTALLLGAAIRIVKPDVRWFPNLDARWRPVALTALGIVASVLKMVASSNDWRAALQWGMSAAGAALLGHVFGIEVLRGGKELSIPGASPPADPPAVPPAPLFPPGARPPGPYSGATMIGLAMALGGCAGSSPNTEAKSAATAAAIEGLKAGERSCEDKVLAIVGAAKTCLEAADGLNRLALAEPTCAPIMGGPNYHQFCRGGSQ